MAIVMALRADDFNDVLLIPGIPFGVIEFVSPVAIFPNVSAVHARNGIWFRKKADVGEMIGASPGLLLIAVPGNSEPPARRRTRRRNVIAPVNLASMLNATGR